MTCAGRLARGPWRRRRRGPRAPTLGGARPLPNSWRCKRRPCGVVLDVLVAAEARTGSPRTRSMDTTLLSGPAPQGRRPGGHVRSTPPTDGVRDDRDRTAGPPRRVTDGSSTLAPTTSPAASVPATRSPWTRPYPDRVRGRLSPMASKASTRSTSVGIDDLLTRRREGGAASVRTAVRRDRAGRAAVVRGRAARRPPRAGEAVRRARSARHAPRGLRLRGDDARSTTAWPATSSRRSTPACAAWCRCRGRWRCTPIWRLRQRGAEAGVAAADGHRRRDRLLRAHRARPRLRPGRA